MAQSDVSLDENTVAQTALPQAEVVPPHWKRNFVANLIDVTFFSLGLSFSSLTTIVPLFIRELGGSTLMVGLVPAIVQTGWVLPPLFVARYIGRMRRKMPYVLRVTVGERVPWAFLALGTFLLAGYPTLLLTLAIICLAVFGLSGGLAMPGWMDTVARVTPLRMRGQLFGWSGAIGGVLGVGGGLMAERVLRVYDFPLNFALCFLAAFICMALSFVALFAIREPEAETSPPTASIGEYLRALPALLRADRDFAAFLAARWLTVLGSMAVALITVYATEQRGLPESMAGRFTAWMLGTQVITTPLFGAIGDRYGHKLPLQFALGANALAMLLGLVATGPGVFYLIFCLIGASSGIFFTTTLNMVVEFARPDERVTYIGINGTFVSPATFVAPLFGGWFAGAAGFPALFVVASICSLLALAILSLRVRDPRHRQLR